jgi:hypothetical protein
MNDQQPVKALANRTFGLIFAGIFAIIALFPVIWGHETRQWAAIIGGVFLIVSLVYPKLLTPLNKLWAKFGQLMHKITNPLIMGIVFFLTVLPTGIILRLFGKDPMQRKFDAEAESYWIVREKSKIDATSFDQQF